MEEFICFLCKERDPGRAQSKNTREYGIYDEIRQTCSLFRYMCILQTITMLRNKFQLEVAKTHIRKISAFLYRETDVDEHILNISVLLRTIVLPKVGSLLWPEICDLAKSVSNWDQGKFRKGILEPWTASTNQNLRELAEAALRSVALEYINRSGSKPPKAFLQTIEDLKTCDDIVITKPDKRSSVVVMDKSEYLRLLPEASINNTSKFPRLRRLGETKNQRTTS